MMANDLGLDFARIRRRDDAGLPARGRPAGAGFAAGPCLFKDTMQLASVTGGSFALGHSAMLVNEGCPTTWSSGWSSGHDLSSMTVGILGMAFKAESDDRRSSLSYRLKRVLAFRAARVLTPTPTSTTTPTCSRSTRSLARADLLVIGAPHEAYRDLADRMPVVDIWNLPRRGATPVTPTAVIVVIPAYHEDEASAGCLDRSVDAITLDFEILIVVDFAEDPTVAAVARARRATTGSATLVNTYGRGPANAIRYGIDHAAHPVVVVTMADG